MEAEELQYNRCKNCSRAISMNQEFCSEDCEKEYANNI